MTENEKLRAEIKALADEVRSLRQQIASAPPHVPLYVAPAPAYPRPYYPPYAPYYHLTGYGTCGGMALPVTGYGAICYNGDGGSQI